MSEKSLAIQQSNIISSFDDAMNVATAMAKSGYFQDSKDANQAIVKVLAGSELGLGPFASMTGIHIIQGRPSMGANLIATLIKNDPRYNYRVIEHTDKTCKIEFYENGQKCGVSEFSAEDARKAGTKNMDKYPRNMLFARAISNGARWYSPGIFGGAAIYTPDELGADTDEDGNVIAGSFKVIEPEPEQPTNPTASVADQGIIEEPEPQAAPLTLAQAKKVKNSEGVAYGDIETSKLAHMANAIAKMDNPTPEHEKKLLAIQIILADRNKTKK